MKIFNLDINEDKFNILINNSKYYKLYKEELNNFKKINPYYEHVVEFTCTDDDMLVYLDAYYQEVGKYKDSIELISSINNSNKNNPLLTNKIIIKNNNNRKVKEYKESIKKIIKSLDNDNINKIK